MFDTQYMNTSILYIRIEKFIKASPYNLKLRLKAAAPKPKSCLQKLELTTLIYLRRKYQESHAKGLEITFQFAI